MNTRVLTGFCLIAAVWGAFLFWTVLSMNMIHIFIAIEVGCYLFGILVGYAFGRWERQTLSIHVSVRMEEEKDERSRETGGLLESMFESMD